MRNFTKYFYTALLFQDFRKKEKSESDIYYLC